MKLEYKERLIEGVKAIKKSNEILKTKQEAFVNIETPQFYI